MFSKVVIVSALAALAIANPVKLANRQSTPQASIVNNISDGTGVNFAVIEQVPASGTCDFANCIVASGTVAAGGASTTIPFNPAGSGGYSVKLCSGDCDPATQGATGLLQFEYTLSADGSTISYDWSCVNCGPDPFAAYTYIMSPYSGAPTTPPPNGQDPGQCATLECDANAQTTAAPCYYYGFMATTSGQPPNCPLDGTTGVALTATFS